MIAREGRFPPFLLPVALTLIAVAYRAPMLLSASGATNSDSAVVGLQALHIVEHQDAGGAFLWGSHYQTAVDSWLAALVFAVTGPGPRALMATSLTGYVLLVLFAYGALSTPTLGIGRVRASILAMLLVFAGAPVHGYALFPPRQAALTLAFAALFAAERAELRGHHSVTRIRPRLAALAGALGLLAVFADPYALLFVPALATRALWYEGKTRLAALGGAAIGAIPFVWLTTRAAAGHGTFGFAPSLFGHNAALLGYPCLPWALGAIDFTPAHFLRWVPWRPPLPWSAIGPAAVALLVVLLGESARKLVVGSSRGPQRHAPLAAAAWAGIGVTLAGFTTSVMVMDLFSTRYLVSLVLLVPFALATIASRTSAGLLAALLLLPVSAGALSGIAGYGPFVHEVDDGAREASLEEFLAARDVHHAVADYWVAYRLTFLTAERLVVVPANAAEDRWPAYREQVQRAPRLAYIWDPARSREDAAAMEIKLRNDGYPFERSDVAGYRVLVTTGALVDR